MWLRSQVYLRWQLCTVCQAWTRARGSRCYFVSSSVQCKGCHPSSVPWLHFYVVLAHSSVFERCAHFLDFLSAVHLWKLQPVKCLQQIVSLKKRNTEAVLLLNTFRWSVVLKHNNVRFLPPDFSISSLSFILNGYFRGSSRFRSFQWVSDLPHKSHKLAVQRTMGNQKKRILHNS